MAVRYLEIDEMVAMIDEPARAACERILADNRERFEESFGSTHNHQAWPGGYVDHVQEVMNVVRVLYETLGALRRLPFSLSDALLVAFFHDIEKPWKYTRGEDGHLEHVASMQGKDAHHAFRREMVEKYGLTLTPEQDDGIRFIEGEIDSYSNRRRAMGPLAAFCHLADVTSSRLWFDHPLEVEDSWTGAGRFRRSDP